MKTAKKEGKFVGVGSILIGTSKFDQSTYSYVSINVYCGKDKNQKPIHGGLYLKTLEEGEEHWYEVKNMRLSDPSPNQDTSFVKKNLSVNLLNSFNVVPLAEEENELAQEEERPVQSNQSGKGKTAPRVEAAKSAHDDSFDF